MNSPKRDHRLLEKAEVKKLRGNLDTEILLAGVPQLTARHERIAVEIVKLAEKRHHELIK
jgi:type I restriction enzyme R subunit